MAGTDVELHNCAAAAGASSTNVDSCDGTRGTVVLGETDRGRRGAARSLRSDKVRGIVESSFKGRLTYIGELYIHQESAGIVLRHIVHTPT